LRGFCDFRPVPLPVPSRDTKVQSPESNVQSLKKKETEEAGDGSKRLNSKFQAPTSREGPKHQTSKVQQTDKMSDKTGHLKRLEIVHNRTQMIKSEPRYLGCY